MGYKHHNPQNRAKAASLLRQLKGQLVDMTGVQVEARSNVFAAAEAYWQLSKAAGVHLYSRGNEHLSALNRYLRFEAGLSPAVREVAILITAREMDSQFEWCAHENEALKVGVSPATVDAIKHRKSTAGLDETDATIIALGREMFGEYQLLEPLGRGGMASVFKAERNGEVRALKRPLYAFLEEPEFLERFTREAEIGRTLHHPNVIRVLEHGQVEGVPFLAMELLPGETLQARIERRGAMAPRDAAAVVVQIADNAEFTENVRTLFNNDIENKAGQGAATHKQYFETNEGKLIEVKGAKARYVRLYSRGSTESALNEYTIVEIWGKAAQ